VSPSQPRVSIVIPAYNAAATIEACLESVRGAMASWGPADLVVVDNGSTDGTYDRALESCGSMGRVLREPEASIGRLRNLGAAATAGPILSFIDSDCVIPPDYFAQAWTVFTTTGAGAAGSLYALPPSPGWIEAVWIRLHDMRRDGPVRWLNGGNLLVRREAFDAVGGFNETLRTGEDVEFCGRLRAAGTLIYHDRRIAAVHLGNPVTFRSFFRQQWWHGLGTSLRDSGDDKPLGISLFYLVATVAALGAWIFGWSRGIHALALIAASQVLPPALAVGYRAIQTRRLVNPPAAMVLYWVYFWSRLAALSSILLGVPRAHRGRR
jgi:glycosyltransferase involved in cell wall biosynthesis